MKRYVFLLAILAYGIIFFAQASNAAGKDDHAGYAKLEIKECNACHKSEGIAPNHGIDFAREHRALGSKAGNNCKACHEQKFCLDCHQGGGDGAKLSFGGDFKPKSHRSDFVSLHPMKALDNPQQCYRCHEPKAFCNSCHDRFPKGRMHIKSHLRSGGAQTYAWWRAEHSTEARRNLASCAACHQDGDVCLQCHSAKVGAKINPHPRSFKGLNGRGNSTCRKCH